MKIRVHSKTLTNATRVHMRETILVFRNKRFPAGYAPKPLCRNDLVLCLAQMQQTEYAPQAQSWCGFRNMHP